MLAMSGAWKARLAIATAAAVIGTGIGAGALAPQPADAALSARQGLPAAVLARMPGGVGPGLVSDEHRGRRSQRALGADLANLEVQFINHPVINHPASPPAGPPVAGQQSRTVDQYNHLEARDSAGAGRRTAVKRIDYTRQFPAGTAAMAGLKQAAVAIETINGWNRLAAGPGPDAISLDGLDLSGAVATVPRTAGSH